MNQTITFLYNQQIESSSYDAKIASCIFVAEVTTNVCKERRLGE